MILTAKTVATTCSVRTQLPSKRPWDEAAYSELPGSLKEEMGDFEFRVPDFEFRGELASSSEV